MGGLRPELGGAEAGPQVPFQEGEPQFVMWPWLAMRQSVESISGLITSPLIRDGLHLHNQIQRPAKPDSRNSQLYI